MSDISWNALRSLRLLHRTGRYSKVLTGPSQLANGGQVAVIGYLKRHQPSNMTKSSPRSPYTAMRVWTMSLTHLEIHHRHLTLGVQIQTWVLQMILLTNCFVENIFRFISPFKLKVKICLFIWGRTAQHYPGLGHGSYCNGKETSVISIQKIHPLVLLNWISAYSGI